MLIFEVYRYCLRFIEKAIKINTSEVFNISLMYTYCYKYMEYRYEGTKHKKFYLTKLNHIKNYRLFT